MRGFTEIERDAKALRGRAKAQGDARLLQILSNGFPQAGISSLETLAEEFCDSLTTTYQSPDWRTLSRDSAAAAASVLGDCFGMRGGALRRSHDLERAIAAYDEGFRYESEPEFSIRVSYNRVQRLAVRIINTTHSLREPGDLRLIEVPMLETIVESLPRCKTAPQSKGTSTVLDRLGEAEKAIDAILQSTKSEERDVWQEADLAFVRLLLGDARPNEKLWGKISNANTKVFESTRNVIDDLKTKFEPSGPGGLRARFEDTSHYFAEILSFA